MQAPLTPAARRTIASCRRMVNESSTPQEWCDFLMFALLQHESLAAAALQRLGVSLESLLKERHSSQTLERAATHLNCDTNNIETDCNPNAGSVVELDDPLEFIQILDRASAVARGEANSTGVSSAHLLIAIFETNDVLQRQLLESGVDRPTIITELNLETIVTGPPLPIDFDLNLSLDCGSPSLNPITLTKPTESTDAAWRIIDANLNRSREGVRVLEDYARFVRNDGNLSGLLKNLRHELVAAENYLPKRFAENLSSSELGTSPLLMFRDTAHDVGTQLSTAAENIRSDMSDVVIANSRRIQESLRSLEEFGKLVSPQFAATIKQIRYRSYTLQQQLAVIEGRLVAATDLSNLRELRIQKLHNAVLYVLITESTCQLPWQQVAELSLRGNADVLQLREKHLNDRELLRRGRWIADACREADRLFIMNDRPDIAVAANADGVHVGQDEFAVADVRAVLRPDQIVGVSTHSMQQANAAQSDGADYIGVGPTFPSVTKSFEEYPGLELVRQVFANVQLPAFAIGGINGKNLSEVVQAGGSRIAVTACVSSSADPALVLGELRATMAKRYSVGERGT